MGPRALRGRWRPICVAWGLLWLAKDLPSALAQPTATIATTGTQARAYTSQVQLSYFSPVNCTITFSEEVTNFGVSSFTKTNGTRILRLTYVSPTVYTFQVDSDTTGNVSISIAPGTVQNVGGVYNTATLASYSFLYYAYPPSVTMRLDGYTALSTSKNANLAYLIFNSTTEFDGTTFFAKSFVSLSPAMNIYNFQRVNSMMYKFTFVVVKNTTLPASSEVRCVDPSTALPSSAYTMFLCSRCPRSQRCLAPTRYPPAAIEAVEFPLQVVIAPVPILGMPGTSLPFTYDTLWALISMQAPAYAEGPFYITVTWTEPMADLSVALPVFDASGPAVDQDVLKQNLTILNSSSMRVLVVPAATGILRITINGTQDTMDLAGNANNFRTVSQSRTGASCVVVYSAGPPTDGTVAFQYSWPQAVYEVRATAGSPLGNPSLAVSWSGFTTATRYDLWATWGGNLTTVVMQNLTDTSYTFLNFEAMLGLEYTVYVRAYNYFGDSTTVSKVFLHPEVQVDAGGTYKVVNLPNFLSPTQTAVAFDLFVPDDGFLAVNPKKILAVRPIDRQAGDAEPCMANSELTMCTDVNFHVEVPGSDFVVFRKPFRLQFTFGREGWQDVYFKPQLRYWETYDEEWRSVAATCTPDQSWETWNDLHKIYTVSVCHLSQFAIFEVFAPPPPTTTTPPPPRPSSYQNPMIFVGLGIALAAVILICVGCYLARVRPWERREPKVAFDQLGIRPVTERLPSRRPPGLANIAVAPSPEDARELLALPAAEGGEQAQAVEDDTHMITPSSQGSANPRST